MMMPGADALGMTHSQCLTLREKAEDTLNFLAATLTYLIDVENRQPQPDTTLIAQWKELDREIFDLEYSLPGADVETYLQVVETYAKHDKELRPLVERYMGTP